MFAWVWLYILQSWNSAESVNPGTLCDGVLRAQHSPLRGRLLFIPVMSILLGISASLHTTCCAQQCGEANTGRVVVSACQSQSQGSVSSHQSEKPYPDVACLPSPHVLPPKAVLFPLLVVLEISTSTHHTLSLSDTSDHFIPWLFSVIHCFKNIDRNIFLQLKKVRVKKVFYFQPQGRLFVSVFVLESLKGRADVGEESSQRW